MSRQEGDRMAKLKTIPLEAFTTQLVLLGDMIMSAGPEMIDAGLVPLEKEIRKNAERHKISGDLAKSVRKGKPKMIRKRGIWSGRVSFIGYEKDSKKTPMYPKGKPNAVKAMALEYGRSGQSATPIIRPAIESAQIEVIDVMQGIFNDKINEVM